MDANEDIYKKSLGKSITAIDGLNMNEVVGNFTGKKIGATLFKGSKPIDAIWTTPDIVLVGACVSHTGLRRWVVMVFQGSIEINTRIVCGYN